MNIEKTIVTYRRLREQPVWRLLAADNGPIICALLQKLLLDNDRCLPASVLHERIARHIESLQAGGYDLPQTAQAYVSDWLNAGWLERRFPVGAGEEEFEISTAAATAVRFIAGLDDRRTLATESRLSSVIQQLVRLSEETDTNPESRVAALEFERARIDRVIEAIRQGRIKTLTDDRAFERIQEIIAVASELAEDFRGVRDEFEGLNRDLRERLLDSEGSRGEVLEALFAGVDVIAETDAGRTFYAFWRLLIDPEQSAAFEEALSEVLSRSFSARLDPKERRFLLRLIQTLLNQGGMVHEVLQTFARSLKQFVQSREYREQRRLNYLLKNAQRIALSIKNEVRSNDSLDFHLQLTSCSLRSVSQWVLYDPSLQAMEGGMVEGEAAPIDLATVGELVAESEIDFRQLKDAIRTILDTRSQASIGEILDLFPATQGLGSVVGYLALGSRHGERIPNRNETVAWRGKDDRCRAARIPTIFFLREKIDELA